MNLTSVAIPESVTEIGRSAFKGCPKLANQQGMVIIHGILFGYMGSNRGVTIPAGVKEIEAWAFYDCAKLTSVTIPAGVTEIGFRAFYGCANLTSVTIPEGVTEIGRMAFDGCASLTSVTIPAGVTVIRESTFSGCANLTSVTIPGSVKEIDKYVFQGCRPVLITPHIPISSIAKEDKPGACAGFAKAYLDGREIDEDIKAGYLKYIKGQKKRLFPLSVHHEQLLRVMLAEKMIVRKDIDPLLEECDKQSNISAKAAVLDYAGRSLEPVDPFAEMEKELAKMERQAKRFEKTGQLPASELKKIWSTKKLEDGTLEITSYKGTDTTVSVPAVIGKTAVTAIGEKALSPLASRLTPEQSRVRETLGSVTIPEGVTKIGAYAF